MARLFTIIALFVLSVGSAHAQQSAYNITIPPGWELTASDERGETYTSATHPKTAGVLIMTVLPLALSPEEMFAKMTDMQIPDKQAEPLQRSRSDGAEIIIQNVTGAKANGNRTYTTFYARAEKDAFGMLMFTARTRPAYEHNKPLADAMFASFRLTDEMAQRVAQARKEGRMPPANR